MKVFTQINDEYKNLALALGFFDGVHTGHQKVISSAVNFSRQKGTQAAVITFREHPQVLLRGIAPEYILTDSLRRQKISELGVDLLFELDFKEFAQLSGEEYIRDVLVENFAPVSISTGFNHYFGMHKSGTPELLEECSSGYGYTYFKILPVELNGEIVSSSLIRKRLAEGNIKCANDFLGYKFFAEGMVQHGAHLASKIGFKTANIHYPQELVKLPFGVYSVLANGLPAIANFGVKPTFAGLASQPVLEVHILNFDKDIYGEILKIEFVDFIRPERKFDSVEALVWQIKTDIDMVQNIVHNEYVNKTIRE